VCYEFVGENGGVGFDFNEVDSYGGYFGKDDASEGVGEGEVDLFKGEVDFVGFRLRNNLLGIA
jgi:hypothetical protein